MSRQECLNKFLSITSGQVLQISVEFKLPSASYKRRLISENQRFSESWDLKENRSLAESKQPSEHKNIFRDFWAIKSSYFGWYPTLVIWSVNFLACEEINDDWITRKKPYVTFAFRATGDPWLQERIRKGVKCFRALLLHVKCVGDQLFSGSQHSCTSCISYCTVVISNRYFSLVFHIV